MAWTVRDEQVWEEIEKWEGKYFSKQVTDFSLTAYKLFNSSLESLGPMNEKLLASLDDIIFHFHAIIQHRHFDEKKIAGLLSQARIFREDIYYIEDMKKLTIDQLRFIAEKQLARQKAAALFQGGATGTGGLLFMLADLPLMLAVNLRTIQLTAMNYGYDLRNPYEMMLVLKLFHAVSLPHHLQLEAWEEVFREAESSQVEAIFYDGKEDVTSKVWMQQPLKQTGKLLALGLLRKKTVQGVPLLGVAVGAGVNYTFARHVAEASHVFYQKRYLLEKKNK
ncbi:EcsC family protein [Evansella clarkii]|uniref:EcsC family protein n=1 Tax=Evansella clarkii TaxID=79879 RepID=UPI000B44A3EC|nr:EcsC family protein [Evansella clarkii]